MEYLSRTTYIEISAFLILFCNNHKQFHALTGQLTISASHRYDCDNCIARTGIEMGAKLLDRRCEKLQKLQQKN